MPHGRRSEHDLVWPLQGRVIARYGQPRDGEPLKGIDIEASLDAEVHAAASGTVLYAQDQFPGMGGVVVLDHGTRLTLYGHLSQILIETGQAARQGDPIGRVGRSGRTPTPRLHFRLYQDERPIDPLPLLNF
jgi:septal ring factor EnvC (AmiA/AmiB activator)